MASESTEEGTVTVNLPAELEDWLDERAAALDEDRETVLVQLLASYRATVELDGEFDPANGQGMPVAETETVEETVESILADRLDERVESAVRGQVQAAVDAAVEERVSEAVRQRVAGRIADVEDDYMDKISDVRERVVQLKRELDGRAAADHDHAELDRVDELATEVETLQDHLDSLEDDVGSRLDDQRTETDDIEERLDSVQDRLQTVAWVVSDLREAHEDDTGTEAVDRIKRAAAKADVERARCESCGAGVSIGLLTEPECPHCQATVTSVEPASGFFGKAQLLTASQLESGERR
ncbi:MULTISPECIES: hypothetical protein [Salinibaculum]|uniref:hypothetical protein n=1 Tax=Salinibaculum TaxID=2732368 RepID=UPI0030D0AFA6